MIKTISAILESFAGIVRVTTEAGYVLKKHQASDNYRITGGW